MLTSIVKAFGFALYALAPVRRTQGRPQRFGSWKSRVGSSPGTHEFPAGYTGDELWITQSMGFTVQSTVTDWTILRVLAEKRPTQNLASSLLYREPEIESFFTPQRKWRGQPADHPTYAPRGGPSLPRALYGRTKQGSGFRAQESGRARL